MNNKHMYPLPSLPPSSVKNLRILSVYNPTSTKYPPSLGPPYQFQPCLLDGECLSIRDVSFSRDSFLSRTTWETDWFSAAGLGGGGGRLCSLDPCRRRLPL